jgi:hypothetical protein
VSFKGLPRKNPVPLEKEVQRDILDWLERVGVLCWRSNSGTMTAPATATTARRFVKFSGAEGLSDISMVLPGGRAGFCEVKRPGNNPTEKQQGFIDRVNRQGGVAFVARSVLDVQRALAAEGYFVRLGTMDPPSYSGEALALIERALTQEV